MWINSLNLFPIIFNFSALTFFYMYNNLDFNHSLAPAYQKTQAQRIQFKDFTGNILRVWIFLLLSLLISLNFSPIHTITNTHLTLSNWRVGLITTSTLFSLFIVFLMKNNSFNLDKLLYNEFFLVLLLYLPGLYTILVGSTNVIFLYIILELFAVVLLTLVYTSCLLNASITDHNNMSKQTFFIVFYQFIFNFFASLFFALMLIFFMSVFGVISYVHLSPRLYMLHTYYNLSESQPYVYLSQYLPVLFIVFFFIKFGVGPWFAFKIHLYRYLQPSLLFVYLFIYFVFLLPYGIWLVYTIFYLSYASQMVLFTWIVLSLVIVLSFTPNLTTLPAILSLSSVLFYLFIITQFLFMV